MSDHSSNRGSRRSRGAGRGNGQRGRGARVFFRNDQTADNGHSGTSTQLPLLYKVIFTKFHF